ncbi:MAG: exonuclease SbcCD subunit D [Bacteroidales bacterium]|nr:exonuclease SbcCD subunit D [Bacteroidales bacterium]
MKFLHTSDWHIGQTFHGYDRKKEHLFFLEWLKKTLRERSIDVLLIAGDVFDSPNPSAVSQKLFYRFLKDIHTENPELQVVVIAGNHDSAGRLEAPNPLLEEMNITIKGNVHRDICGEIDYKYLLVPLYEKGEIAAYCISLPFLRQGDYPESDSCSQGIQRLIEEITASVMVPRPIVVMAHLHTSGAELSENDLSERTIIGGIECISPEAFLQKNIVYTALGHLHKAQKISENECIRYAGSPIPMSFTEKNYKQGVCYFEIQDEKITSLEVIKFEAPVKLLSIPKKPGELTEIMHEIHLLPDGEITDFSPFLEIKVLLKEPEPSIKYKLEEALKNKSVKLASLKAFYLSGEEGKTFSYEELQTIEPIEIAEDVFMRQYGEAMPQKIKSLLIHLIEDIKI